MTKKRFIVDTCGTLIDMETRDTFDYVSEVVDLLNRLVNEITTYDAGNQLLKRNFDECRKENEQLKSTIKEVTELLSDEVDVFSEKATEHDIIAYEELKELDNKDAFYMATATKEAIKLLKELQE